MKKNIVTIILALAVLSIWCIVFYRLFGPSEKIEIVSETPKVNRVEKELIKLSLNYKDPFKIEKPKPKQSSPIIPEQPPNFRYKGLVKGTKSRLVIVENNGISEAIELSDSLLGFKIISINNDSVVVRQKVRRYTIVKN